MSEVYLERAGECATCGEPIVCAVQNGSVVARECLHDMATHRPRRDILWEHLQQGQMDRATFNRWMVLIVKEEREVPYATNVKGREEQ